MSKIEKILSGAIFLMALVFIIYKKGYFDQIEEIEQQHAQEAQQVENSIRQEIINAKPANLEDYKEVAPIKGIAAPTPQTEKKGYTNITEEQFQKLLTKYRNALPTKKDLMKLKPGQVHHIPEPVIEMGRRLGEIKEILAKHPEFEDSGITFYKNCADNPEGLTSIRALCLSNLVLYKRKQGEDFDISKYPDRIQELAQAVLD